MLARDQKIPSSYFSSRVKQKCIYRSAQLSCYQNSGLSTAKARFAVVISKKKTKKAAHRNKIKRIIYSLIQEYYPQFCQKSFFVIRVNTDLLLLSKEDLRNDILQILKKQKKS